MEIVTKVMEKSWKFVGKNVYEPCCLHDKKKKKKIGKSVLKMAYIDNR